VSTEEQQKRGGEGGPGEVLTEGISSTMRIMPSVWPPDCVRSAALVTWTGLGILTDCFFSV
jgi:hypothetical protein